MKAICYISNFSDGLTKDQINKLINFVSIKNNKNGISGLLIIKNKYFFQVLEGKKEKVDSLYEKIKTDHRHKSVITLLDTPIEDRIFKDFNGGKYEVFQRYTNMKKLYLYFNWIKNAEYLPAAEIIQLTTNFLKFNR